MPTWIAARPNRSVKVVVDMDAFYMNCELLSRPDIADHVPACVGGSSMILTSNYAARRYGVRSAMPGYIGSALVEQLSKGKEKLIFCPSNFELYHQKSNEMKQVLSQFDPNLAAYSLDEVYLDLGPYIACSLTHPNWTHEQISAALVRQHGTEPTTTSEGRDEEAIKEEGAHTESNDKETGIYKQPSDETTTDSSEALTVLLTFTPAVCLARTDEVVADMRNRVRSVTGGLTCSAGVAPNFLLAKIASDRNKPNGQLIVASDHEKVTEFLHPLPIRKVSGIGRVTEKILNGFGIATVQQLYEERGLVRFLFEDSSTAGFLLRASVGCASSDGKVSEEESASSHQKGISRERTMQPGKSWAEINSKFEDIAQLLSQDMKRKKLSAQTITVKVKMSTFDMLSRARSMPRGVFVQSAEDILKVATELLHEIRQKEVKGKKEKSVSQALFSVRLLGIRCSNLVGDDERRSESATQKTIDSFFQQPKTDVCDAQATISEASRRQLAPAQPNSFDASSPLVNPYSPQKPSAAELKSPNNGAPSDEHKTPLDAKNESDTAFATATTESVIDDKASPPTMECPVCGIELSIEDNGALNRHIDACLNGTMVRQAVREESARAKPQLKKPSRSLPDFFRSDASKAAR